MRGWIVAIALLGVFLCTQLSCARFRPSADMVLACTRVAQDYAWLIDHPGEDSAVTARVFAELFTEDAVLELANPQRVIETFVGHEAIAGRYLQGRSVLRTIHAISNVRIVPTGDGTARGSSYVTVYMHPVGASMAEAGIRGLAEYRDEYRMTHDGCRISKRVAVSRLVGMDGTIEAPRP